MTGGQCPAVKNISFLFSISFPFQPIFSFFIFLFHRPLTISFFWSFNNSSFYAEDSLAYWLSLFLFFFSLFSFILAWTFISLQIKEFSIMGLSINDSVYSCVFFFLSGLHFFHLFLGLFLLSLLFWSCSFQLIFEILSCSSYFYWDLFFFHFQVKAGFEIHFGL